jgi:hypothetical protein
MKKIYNDLFKRLELTTDSLELILQFAASEMDDKLRAMIQERIDGNHDVLERARNL